MYVYIWRDQSDTPFYVGLTSQFGRTRPTHGKNRNKTCLNRLIAVGYSNVKVEILTIDDANEAKAMEDALIVKYGKLCDNTGTLTNVMKGGSQHFKSPEEKELHRKRMLSEANRDRMLGDNNPAKTVSVREKLKAVWRDPAYREAQRTRKLGKPIHSKEEKERRRIAMQDPNHPMNDPENRKRLNTDPEIKAKRVAALRSPENRARQAAQMREYWAKKKASTE